MAQDNKSLGRFILDGIPPAPRGMPQVEVTFDIDANGILSVKAKDKATGKEQSVRIEASTGLKKEDIERMKQEAEMHRADDERRRGLIETRNNAEALVYTAEKSMRENAEKISTELKASLEEKIKQLKESIPSEDEARMKTASEELSRALSQIGEALYKQNTEPRQENDKKEPKDIDFEEKKDV